MFAGADVVVHLTFVIMGDREETTAVNLAGEGTLTMSDLADALGWYSVPGPDLALDAAAELVARLPFVTGESRARPSGLRASGGRC